MCRIFGHLIGALRNVKPRSEQYRRCRPHCNRNTSYVNIITQKLQAWSKSITSLSCLRFEQFPRDGAGGVIFVAFSRSSARAYSRQCPPAPFFAVLSFRAVLILRCEPAVVDVHHFFSWGSLIWELKTPPKNWFGSKNITATWPDENSHDLGTQWHFMPKQWPVNSDDFDFRSPVIQKIKKPKKGIPLL